MTSISGDTLDGVSATTLWTLHNRGTEAKRSDGVIRDPWAVSLFDTISYDYRKFGRPNQSHGLRAVAFDRAAREYLTTKTLDRVGVLRRNRPSITLLDFG